MHLELFAPAQRTEILPDSELKFQSYYCVDHMVSVIVENDFERNMEKAYASLMEYAQTNHITLLSSFYHEFFKTPNGGYYIVKAVAEKNNQNDEVEIL